MSKMDSASFLVYVLRGDLETLRCLVSTANFFFEHSLASAVWVHDFCRVKKSLLKYRMHYNLYLFNKNVYLVYFSLKAP